ncbi:uncharacterized protein N0V89_011308 [Didymosphaeria variabile]|uniref:NACHT domain-containing protein n=1 Tax=Didymosphaeria variabile TaxID=1932322 RepID=A0A9W8XDT3_9PLEO|nr:uncharacterized protein N0V89_011308 [Didymosphaeria variabile]KAJ4347367.1 hypothetical protein N0V89_011308 [Didymosphaeria variabile]
MAPSHSDLKQLATAVDDFISFGFALIRDIHGLKGAEGTSSTQNTWLEDSRSYYKRLGTRGPAKAGHEPNATEVKLQQQANACQELADSLINLLEGTSSVPELEKIIDLLRKALPEIEDEMFEILEALNDGSKELGLSLEASSLHDKVKTSGFGQAMRKPQEAPPPMPLLQPSDKSTFGSSSIEQIKNSRSTRPTSQFSAVDMFTSSKPKKAISPPTLLSEHDQVLATLKNKDRAHLVHEYLLESLSYSSMKDREEDVEQAHAHTFSWIFEPSTRSSPSLTDKDEQPMHESNDFLSWLSTDKLGGAYWVSGKPGSGKSTFMRYLYSHPATLDHLKTWAGGTPLTIASFFFWTSGSYDQRSQAGLIRYLLYQILEQHPELTAWTFPKWWLRSQDAKARVKTPIKWTVDDLMNGLSVCVERVVKTTKLCLFVDGLDEFDGQPEEVVKLFKELVVDFRGRIKVCLSSRPWGVFEDAFRGIPQFRLHDLTSAGMHRYVSDKLNGQLRIRQSMQQDPKTGRELQTEIVRRADGVFLWTTLAVRRLIESEDASVDGLKACLDTLPTDLDDLFHFLLFQSRSSKELEEQSRIFNIICAKEAVCDFTRDESARSMTAYQLRLAFWGNDTSLQGTIRQVTEIDAMESYEACKSQLSSLCADLLVLHSRDPIKARYSRLSSSRSTDRDPRILAESRIAYLHRTVRDFLLIPEVWEGIRARSEKDFDSHIDLLRSHALQLRVPLEEPSKHRRLDDWWPDIVLALTHARFSHPRHCTTQIRLLDELNTTLNWYWATKESDPLDNWARNAFGSYEERMKRKTPYHYPFLSLCAKFGLDSYLNAKLSTGKYGYQGGIPLLSHAIEFLFNRRKTVYPLTDPIVIESLLANGEDPNQLYQDLSGKKKTPWLLALQYSREADRRKWIKMHDTDETGTKRWVKVLIMFIEHGADPNALLIADGMDPAATALDVATILQEKYQTEGLSDLHRLLLARGAELEDN